VIHVATVHWRSDHWIDIQRRHLDRYLDSGYRAYAFLNELPADHTHKFFYASTELIEDHATKLNLLCDVISVSANDPSDLLVVMDGDAFPVNPITPLVSERLSVHKLIAVQRYENNRDLQPHPCFCITTIGFWREVRGDWHKGYRWTNARGELVTDVGGNMLGALEEKGIDWYPLRRVNRVNPHPLFFALYGDRRHGPVVYHHGGGFRKGVGRVNLELHGGSELQSSLRVSVCEILQRHGPAPVSRLAKRYNPVNQLRRTLKKEARKQNKMMMERIAHDDDFWRQLG
jgi:hypothetical protein